MAARPVWQADGLVGRSALQFNEQRTYPSLDLRIWSSRRANTAVAQATSRLANQRRTRLGMRLGVSVSPSGRRGTSLFDPVYKKRYRRMPAPLRISDRHGLYDGELPSLAD